jgi:membrane associated rhomboid family serine protease
VKITEVLFNASFSGYGIYPLSFKGLEGILFSPFIHADFKHLFSNTIPLFFLATSVFYFYSEVALKVLGYTFILTGLLVWIAGREAYHIGASGIIYGLASFLFFSGIIRRYFRLIALSLLIVFLYGSLVWGMMPDLYKNVSWESHMLGFISGIILAISFRNEGPPEPENAWMEEEDEVEVEVEDEIEGDKTNDKSSKTKVEE